MEKQPSPAAGASRALGGSTPARGRQLGRGELGPGLGSALVQARAGTRRHPESELARHPAVRATQGCWPPQTPGRSPHACRMPAGCPLGIWGPGPGAGGSQHFLLQQFTGRAVPISILGLLLLLLPSGLLRVLCTPLSREPGARGGQSSASHHGHHPACRRIACGTSPESQHLGQ